MKCPKCNYTSFDYNQTCPKCGKDNSEIQAQLDFSPNKPNPPFFLASLISMEGSGGQETVATSPLFPSDTDDDFDNMDSEDLLIALEDLDGSGGASDDAEPKGEAEDELQFDLDDSSGATLEPLEQSEDDILFELEPDDQKEQMETVAPELPKQEVPSIDATPKMGERELFLTDEMDQAGTVSAKPGTDATDGTRKADTEPDDMLLSLDDLEEKDTPQNIVESTPETKGEEILFELDGEDEPTAQKTDSEEILFEVEEMAEEGEKQPVKTQEADKGFWDSEEISNQENNTKMAKPGQANASKALKPDAAKETDLFSDLEIEPLDLDLSLDDIEKKTE
jgi:hypothetical protein